jgi:hypothetical protein
MNADDLSGMEVLRFFIEAAKLERTALGEPESIVEINWREKARNAGIDPDELIRRIANTLHPEGTKPDSF